MRINPTPFAPWRAGLLAAALLLSGASALAQWVWVDATGRRVFSDMPPPAGTPDKNIIKRPGAVSPAIPATPASGAAAAPANSAAAAPPNPSGPAPASPAAPGSPGTGAAPGQTAAKPASDGSAAAPKLPNRDPVLEARKREAEEVEAAKKRAAAEKIAQARAENCDRAKRAKGTLASGVRVATTNAKGEREVMDDQRRELEIRRLNEIIAADCAPMAP